MFRPETIDGKLIGHSAEIDGALFFFGTAEGTVARLRARFPELHFAFLTQVHGRDVVEADDARARADAHFTARENLACVVVTADCVPVLLASRGQVCGVHAGWRGVEAGVVPAARARFEDPVRVACVGPHLTALSFEVGRDVADRLSAAAPPTAVDLARPHADPAKVYFDLSKVVRAQLAGIERVVEFTPDTLTTPEYHSYRRARGGVGRNLSFVARVGSRSKIW